MTVGIALFVFLACIITTLVSSEVLVRGLTVLGSKLTLTEGFLGLLTALGADAPEIAAAIAALLAGAAGPLCRAGWTGAYATAGLAA